MAYAYGVGALQAMWDAANSEADLMDLHTKLDDANNAIDPFTGQHNCPIDATPLD
jgi:hypothetical protein